MPDDTARRESARCRGKIGRHLTTISEALARKDITVMGYARERELKSPYCFFKITEG